MCLSRIVKYKFSKKKYINKKIEKQEKNKNNKWHKYLNNWSNWTHNFVINVWIIEYWYVLIHCHFSADIIYKKEKNGAAIILNLHFLNNNYI